MNNTTKPLPGMQPMPPLIDLQHLDKRFGGVHALSDISLEIQPQEVHALCGENGAGKSTLIKILSGVHQPDRGSVTLGGEPLPLGNVPAIEAMGIAVIHQESTAFPHLNAIDNIFIGHEVRNRLGLLDRGTMARRARELMERLGEHIDIRRPLIDLPVAQRQMVSMARAMARNCRLLIMDEPTASLSQRETEVLFENIRRLRQGGISILYVSHRLDEIFKLADRITVLRDGRHVDTRPVADVDSASLVAMMVGREIDLAASDREARPTPGEPVLSVEGLTRAGAFHDISFTVRAGEILTMAGLVGSGRTEIARAVLGMDPYARGQVRMQGDPLPPGDVRGALNRGLAMVPEDRQHEGLILPHSLSQNTTLGVLDKIRVGPFLSRAREIRLTERTIDQLRIKAEGAHVAAGSLSGGNQQKVVLGKALALAPRLLILDEPTRGVDVGAKAEVYRIIRDLAGRGVAVWIISSDLPEVLHISDRILVMCEGRIKGELTAAEANEEAILSLALPDSSEARSAHG